MRCSETGRTARPRLERFPQRGYVEGFDLADYPGAIAQDGIGALINAVMADPEPVVIVSIGPATNVAAALDAVPEIAARASFVGMHGAVRLGYKGSPTPVPEYNVVCDVAAFRKVLAAPWDISLTPLDSCGLVYLNDCDYACVRDSDAALAGIVMENYRVWARSIGAPEDLVERRSTTLYDTVAITLASGGSDASAYLVMEDLDLHVMDDGLTVERVGGTRVHVATGWRDLGGFKKMLVERLTT